MSKNRAVTIIQLSAHRIRREHGFKEGEHPESQSPSGKKTMDLKGHGRFLTA